MDLDFSFALVSSLTPRSQSKKAQIGDNIGISSQLQKPKPKFGCNPKPNCTTQTLKPVKKDKENCPPKEQLMNINQCSEPNRVSNKKLSHECSRDLRKSSPLASLDMANVAVRKKRIRNNRKPQIVEKMVVHAKSINLVKEESTESSTQQNDTVLTETKSSLDKGTRKSVTFEVLNLFNKTGKDNFNLPVTNTKRKSSVNSNTSLSSQCSTDVIESSLINLESETRLTKVEKIENNHQRLRRSSRTSGLSESLLSTAYDSDSITRKLKNGVKVIQETPETDKSFNTSLKKKRLSLKGTKSPDNGCSPSSIFEKEPLRCIDLQKENDLGRLQKSNACDGQKKKLTKNDLVNLPLEENLSTHYNIASSTNECPKKKLKSNGDSSLTDIFKLESAVQNSFPYTNSKEECNDVVIKPVFSSKDKRKASISPILKEINVTNSDSEKPTSKSKEGNRRKMSNNKMSNKVSVEVENASKTIFQEMNDDKKSYRGRSSTKTRSSVTNLNDSNISVVLPTEVLPKSEHIRNWLKNTQETSVILVSSDSSPSTPTDLVKVPAKKLVSLSPRIKKKIKVAKTSLEEEQKLFEELYGNAQIERLSGDVEEEISVSSCQESVEYSEKVLDKLYGTIWQKGNTPQSVPAKGSKKPTAKKKNPQTERKKHRTSIFDVFSSSSSEDRFEEFLESVQRGKLRSKRLSNRPGTPDFIKDSDSDSNCSITFYHNIASSAVKEGSNNLRHEKTGSVKSSKRNNGRRLSFSSSKDDNCSSKGNSELQIVKKEHKPLTKEKKQRGPKSKKKNEDEVDDLWENNKALFTLVTPLKVKDKKTNEKLRKKLEDVIKPSVPKSVGKSTTPKNIIKSDDKANTEERLRKKYLGQDDFKVPKDVASFKTPTKPIKKDVPYSPALSFLSSLSEKTADLPCHPDAVVYRKDFKKKREELSRKLFNLYNKEIFENKLPEDMLIQWNGRMTSTSGYCYNKRTYSNNQIFRSSRIVLSTKILDRPVRLRDTLIHELCHAATWILDGTSDGHGPSWKAWADKAHRRFPELPVIKRCHDYAISTKYTYKCISCGYSIGRHSKSLDVERKRCGYCLGKFQLFVTTKMSSAAGPGSDQSSTNTRTPRNPNGFALFVKENYATVKKENNVPHAQVMQLLSQKFAQVKISKQNSNKPGDSQ